MLSYLAGAILVVLILVLINKSAMKKVYVAFQSLLGKAGAKALSADPVAVYKNYIVQATEELKGAATVLENQLALKKQYERKFEGENENYNRLAARIKKLKAEAKIDEALPLAQELAKTEKSLSEVANRVQNAATAYQNQMEKIKTIKAKILEYKEKAGSMASDLELSKNEATLAQLNQKFDESSLPFDEMKEAEAEIKRQIDVNQSKAQVSQDLTTPNLKEVEKQETLDARAKELLEKL
jgi:chromosome segregation ATPase